MTIRDLAQTLIRLYPRAWRARYEQEMLALLDQSPSTWRDVFDLARAGAWEWACASRTVRTVASIAAALIASAATMAFGWALQQLPIGPPTFAWLESPILSLAFFATMLLAWVPGPIFTWWREFMHSVQRRNGSPDSVSLGRPYLCGVLVYTLVLMVAIRWGIPTSAWDPGLIAQWFGLDTILLVSVFSDLLNDLARDSRPQSPNSLGPSTLSPSS